MNFSTSDNILVIGSLDEIAQKLGLAGPAIPGAAKSDSREDVFVRHAVTNGKVRSDGKGISVEGELFKLNGDPDGRVVISWETTATSEEELTKPAPLVHVSTDERGPIEKLQPTTYCKVRWEFADGSTLTGVGVGHSKLQTLKDGSRLFSDVTGTLIGSGTGTLEGTAGQSTIAGSIVVPPGKKFFGEPGVEVTQKSIHAFRILRGGDLK